MIQAVLRHPTTKQTCQSLTFYKISSITFMYATVQQNSTLKIVFRLNGNKVTNGINIDKMEASATGILS